MLKINRLEHTKKLYPHFFDKTKDSNFTKHLEIVGKQQQDIRHKLKTIEWGRILEKPIQIWKEQTQPYIYDMHFKVLVKNIKEINVYKNPIISKDEEIIRYEKVDNPNDIDEETGEQKGRVIHETFTYEQNLNFYEKTIKDIETNIYKYTTIVNKDGTTSEIPRRRIIPRDTYVLEIFTWDDYRFLKGYPENDYTLKEDNVLQYRYNETFLNINLEEISYHKYLTFRTHKDNIKQILIRKNDKPIYRQSFIIDNIDTNPTLSDSCYTYFDDSVTNEETYGQGEYTPYYDIEDNEANFGKIYFADIENDEYVFRLPLGDDDFDENGVVKDTYDLEVTVFEKRYRCLQEYDRVYSKRYNGYDDVLIDCFDHDYSLDIIGALLNVPRFRFYQIYRKNNYYLKRTYPTYYDRVTEDDYHYMKRIQYYISNYNHIVFPILEFWKYYHTDATIRSRKRIVGEMDYAYLRTDGESDICGDVELFDDPIFDTETIAEFSINKATNVKGEAKQITIGNTTWYESILVDNVYVVPNADYRLRYGIKDYTQKVSIRLICYNRKGVELRTTPIIPVPHNDSDENYQRTTGYDYEYVEDGKTIPNDTYITIPSDAVSIKIVLESNAPFKFADATFERKTLVNFDNSYLATDTDYNSNVYELYANYYNIPSNIRIGGSERFNILFKRSLPITKKGFFFMDLDEDSTTNLAISTNTTLNLTDIFPLATGNNPYTINKYIKGEQTYTLSYYAINNTPIAIEDITEEDYIIATVTYYENNTTISTEELTEKVHTDTKTHIQQTFTTPPNTNKITISITTENATITNITLSRAEELTNEEMTNQE